MKAKTKIVCTSFIFAFCLTLASCTSRAKASSLTSALDEADRYIAQGYPNDALKVLKSCEKKIVFPLEAIGIYKRYDALGEKKRAQNILKKSLKKNPENLELCAVYSHFLKKQGLFDQAFKEAKILRGTKYGSIYAELFLRGVLKEGVNHPIEFFLTEDFARIYFDAYSGSGDNAWLRNAALCNLCRGQYADAATLVPPEKKNAADAYFWALAYYDAKKFGDAAECLLDAQRLLLKNQSRFAEGRTEAREASGRKVSGIEITSLLSDSYVNMGEDKEAEKVRGDLIASLTLGQADGMGAQSGSTESLLGTIYLNSALYALQRNDERAAYNTLTFVVQKWPDYVPALITYGDFAYNSSRREMDDPLTKSLRDAGVVSTEMKKFDSLPRVSVSDALGRMADSISRTHNDTLYVAKLDLEDKIDTTSDERLRLSRMWRVLEHNATGRDLYPEEIAQYATHTLLCLDRYSEAKDLFVKYLYAKYSFAPEESAEEGISKNIKKMSLWEVEYAAYFAAAEKNTDLTKRLYEYAVYETGFSSATGGTEISPECATQSAVNLAMIYSSTGNKEKALELYGRSGSRATDNFLKSEIMYRLACIHEAQKDLKAAHQSLEFSLYLNPGNGKARLLQNKFTFQERR